MVMVGHVCLVLSIGDRLVLVMLGLHVMLATQTIPLKLDVEHDDLSEAQPLEALSDSS